MLTVVLDACVLYPAPVRDYLLNLAMEKIYYPKWSKEINEEWVRNLFLNRPTLSKGKLNGTVFSMNGAFPKANVPRDPYLIHLLILPDLNDRHVLATAIQSEAERIITSNLKDFPPDYIKHINVRIQHSDRFISELLQRYPEAGLAAFRKQISRLKKPPLTSIDVLNSFQKCGLVETARILKQVGVD
ncbi:MAG: PIN domain-containing protein [Bacteroidota bacterium]